MVINIQYKKANIKDIPEISRVLAGSWQTAYKDIVSDDHWVPFLESGFCSEDFYCLLAMDKERIAGVSIIRQSPYEEFPDDGELVALYLLPQYIGQGTGCGLYRYSEELLKQKAYAGCILNVLSGNQRAIGFYHKMGFGNTGQIEEVTLQGQELLCYRMRKSF